MMHRSTSRPTTPTALNSTRGSSVSLYAPDTSKFAPDPVEAALERPWIPNDLADDDPETKMYVAKVSAEAETHRTRSELKRCQALLERQRVELESLKGLRTVSVRVASDEATRRGRPWSGEDVLRFSSLQKATVPPPASAFHSDEMDEVAAQAVVAMTRRVEVAVYDAVRARAESERAEAESLIQLEQAFPQRVGVEVTPFEQNARMATRSILAQSARTATRLRVVLVRLEEEAASAMSVHASDVRACAARLVAQREALNATLVESIRNVEQDGELSISALLAQVKQLKDKASMDGSQAAEAVAALKTELAEVKQALKEEKIGRVMEYDRHTTTIRGLKADVARLESELAEEEREHKADVHYLAVELANEEEMRMSEGGLSRKAAAEAAARAEAALKAAEAKLREQAEQSYAAREELQARLRELERSKAVSEGKLVRELRVLEERRQYEYNMLKSRNETLTQQVLALQANSSRGRQKLYWSSLKANGPTGSSIDDLTATYTSGYGSSSGYEAASANSPSGLQTPVNPPIGGSGYYQFASNSQRSGGSSVSPQRVPSMKRGGIEIKGTGVEPELPLEPASSS